MRKVTLQTNSGEFTFQSSPSDNLLFAGLSHGLGIPYECATGTCGTCRGRIVEGSVAIEWNEAPGFSRLKREKGDVLMCQARASSDCVLRVPAKVEIPEAAAMLPCHTTGHLQTARKLTADVMEFSIMLSRPMTFEAGQFVVLSAPAVQGGRAYSMVNFGRKVAHLTFVIKQKAGGAFSKWFFDNALDEQEISVFGPLGRAIFRPDEGKDVLCVAGSSGIAGMMSILERANTAGYFRDHTGHVFFGVRRMPDAFYVEELANHVAEAKGKLQVTLALSEERTESRSHASFPNIRLSSGLVADVMAREIFGLPDSLVAFVAGPVAMVDETVRHLTNKVRIPRAYVRYDKFT